MRHGKTPLDGKHPWDPGVLREPHPRHGKHPWDMLHPWKSGVWARGVTRSQVDPISQGCEPGVFRKVRDFWGTLREARETPLRARETPLRDSEKLRFSSELCQALAKPLEFPSYLATHQEVRVIRISPVLMLSTVPILLLSSAHSIFQLEQKTRKTRNNRQTYSDPIQLRQSYSYKGIPTMLFLPRYSDNAKKS